jgi:hypothetical protein
MYGLLPGVMPEAITVSREVAAGYLADDLAKYGPGGPVAAAWRWALYGEGPRPISRVPWSGGLPSATELEGETWFESGWGTVASYAEIRKAKFTLWWLQAEPFSEVPARFTPAAPVRDSYSVSL